MSATQPIETVECSYCEGDRDPHASVMGSFCSLDCYHRHKGEKALNVVKNDHRLCGSCLRFIKQVEPPDEDWVNENETREQFALNNGALFHNSSGEAVLDVTNCPDEQRTQTESVIGFQYRTENAETAIKERDGPGKYDRSYTTGTACKCGNTDPTESVEPLRESEPVKVLTNYVLTFRQLEREGKIDKRLSKDVLFNTFRETGDLDLALGRALYQ